MLVIGVVVNGAAAPVPSLINPLALLLVLCRHVMANHATGTGPEQAVMAGEMPRHATNDGPLDATFGRSRRGTKRNRGHRDSKSRGDHHRFHPILLKTGCDR
jgi:hypothetical protein